MYDEEKLAELFGLVAFRRKLPQLTDKSDYQAYTAQPDTSPLPGVTKPVAFGSATTAGPENAARRWPRRPRNPHYSHVTQVSKPASSS